jgi:hypothetical protein
VSTRTRTPEQRARHAQLERERRRRINGGLKDTRKLFAEVGQRFGRGVVIEPEIRLAARNRRGARLRCDCGNEYEAALLSLFAGKTQSCSCLQREVAGRSAPRTHGLTRHPLYQTWGGMMDRCYNDKREDFIHYGGRGIEVCPEWHDVAVFIAWIEANLGPRPEGLTLDRTGVNGNYEPGNVRWATRAEQARNRRVRRDIALLPERLRQGRIQKAEYEQARKRIEQNPADPEVLDLFTGNVMAALSGEGGEQ